VELAVLGLVSLTVLAGMFSLGDRLPRPLYNALNRWTPQRQTQSIKSSFSVRFQLLKTGVSIWSEQPITGVGPGNYANALVRHRKEVQEPVRDRIEQLVQERVKNPQRRPQRIQRELDRVWESASAHVHNLYLQVAIEFGILGLCGLMFLGIMLLRHFLWAAALTSWAVAGLALLAGVLAHNLTDVTFPSLGMEMAILMGAAWGERRVSSSRPR
jgi:O-antigen ligase